MKRIDDDKPAVDPLLLESQPDRATAESGYWKFLSLQETRLIASAGVFERLAAAPTVLIFLFVYICLQRQRNLRQQRFIEDSHFFVFGIQ